MRPPNRATDITRTMAVRSQLEIDVFGKRVDRRGAARGVGPRPPIDAKTDLGIALDGRQPIVQVVADDGCVRQVGDGGARAPRMRATQASLPLSAAAPASGSSA